MRTVIAGSRHGCPDKVFQRALSDAPFEITEVVCGTAKGVDTQGEQWARSQGIPVVRFEPDWEQYGRAAGPIRNARMAEYAEAAIVIRTADSKGSKDMARKARTAGCRLHEVIFVP